VSVVLVRSYSTLVVRWAKWVRPRTGPLAFMVFAAPGNPVLREHH
jgi:hypothetical protein